MLPGRVVSRLRCLKNHSDDKVPLTVAVLPGVYITHLHIMENALAKLTPEQRQMVMAKAQQEANQQIMQSMMEKLNNACFDKCVGTTVRTHVYFCDSFMCTEASTHLISVFFQGDRLDTKEQACLASCQDRYFDVRAAVQDAIHKRQEKGM